MNAPDAFELPDRYEIREVLASSDAEVIVRGVDKKLLREVLLKRPGPELSRTLAETGDESRALREARALAQVQHDGIVRLLDVVECDGGPLLVMEPTPGETLADRLDREGTLPADEVRLLGLRLAEALEAVHSIGAVHRGLSAANIILRPDGHPCLAGFMFAKFCRTSLGISSISYGGASEDRADDASAKIVPSHPAPEQIYGQAADARSDIFGLGCVLYRCLTGQDAFPAMLTSGWSPPRPPAELLPGVPRGLATTIMKCIARSPLARFPAARDVATALAIEEKSVTSSGRRAWLGAAAGVVAVALAAFFLREDGGGPDAPGDATRGHMVSLEDGRPGAARGPYESSYSNSYALLVGIGDEYGKNGFMPLRNAVRDVEAIASRLPALGFPEENVRILRDVEATGTEIKRALAWLTDDREPNDRLFFYYAGHGEKHEVKGKSGFLVPADGLAKANDSSRATWLRFEDVSLSSRETKAKHFLMAMDCCYAGLIAADRNVSIQTYKERYLTEVAHYVLCSGRDEKVSDGVGDHSPFTEALLDGLAQENKPAVTANELYFRINDAFMRSGLRQQPQFAPIDGKGRGEFVFILDGE